MSTPRLLTIAALLGASWPSHAAILINRGDIGASIAVDYNGSVLGFPASTLGATGNFIYTGASEDGRTFNFNYALSNDSTTTSRLRSFSFDVLGNAALTGLSSTGTYATSFVNPLSGLIGSEVCFSAGGIGCTTGVVGPSAGQSGNGSFALTFAGAMSAIQLDDFGVVYQGVNGLFAGSGIGRATATIPVSTPPVVSLAPDASTWMTMILGFGLVGGMLRTGRSLSSRRRRWGAGSSLPRGC